MVDTKKICEIVRFSFTEELGVSFFAYYQSMQKLFQEVPSIKVSGLDTYDIPIRSMQMIRNSDEHPQVNCMQITDLLSNGTVKGKYFMSSRSVTG